VLEQPQAVLDLLAGQAAGTDWFCDQVSFRLGYTARRLLARTRALAERLGISVPDSATAIDEASLDIDA
jgi:hypothetical protein